MFCISLTSSVYASPQYQYNSANQLAKVTLEDGTVIDNFYDGLGNLVRQAIDGDSRDIILNELAAYPNVIGVVPTSGNADRVAYGPDGAVAERSGSNHTRYLVKDQLGTIKGNADDSGALQGRQVLSAYGVSRGNEGETSVLGYTGEYVDESGLIYLRARHYNPAIARFVQKDSYEGHTSDPASMNNYSYVHNNPLSNTDPSGHIVCGGACIGGIVVGGAGLGLMAWDAYKQHKRNKAYQAWKKQQVASGQWGDGDNASRYTPDSEGAPLDDIAHGIAMEALAPFASKLSRALPTPAIITDAANGLGNRLARVKLPNLFARNGTKSNLPDWCTEIPDSEAAKIIGKGKKKKTPKVNPAPTIQKTSDIAESVFGKAVKDSSQKTKIQFHGQPIFKITKNTKLGDFKLRKGDYYYVDGMHKDHIEVFGSDGKARGVLNLDGTLNVDKSQKAMNRSIKL